MYREGPWKIVRSNGFDWELFNLETDPTETRDLSREHPERLAEMAARYNERYRAMRRPGK
jgi:arylsulfatase